MRVAVVGAGPAGLAAAHALTRGGAQVLLLERGEAVGGLARTLTLWNRPVEMGPHVITADSSDAHTLFAEHVGADATVPSVRRGLEIDGRLFSYPPGVADVLALLGPAGSVRAGIALALARLTPRVHESTEDVLVSRYGEVLYDALMSGIFSKLWGRRPSEIDASYGKALVSAAAGAAAGPAHYPASGLSTVWNSLVKSLGPGAHVRCNTDIKRAHWSGNRWIIELDAGSEEADALIWSGTMPGFTRVVEGINGDAAAAVARLESRHILAVHLLSHAGRLPYSPILVANSARAVGRVSDSRTWFASPGAPSETVITMEFWCDDAHEVWKADDEAVAKRAESELRALDVFQPLVVHGTHVVRLPFAIPIPTRRHRAALAAIDAATAALPNLTRIGRHGTFLYDSVLSAMSQGLAQARTMLARLS